MVTVCPTCKASIGLKKAPPAAGAMVRCSSCGTAFRLVPRKKAVSVVFAMEDPDICSTAARILNRYRVYSCHDGHSALAAIERFKPRVAVIDVALPGLYGFQVCEAVRSNPALSGVKLVIITAAYDVRRYTRSPASMYGADALLEKHRLNDSLNELIVGLMPEQPGVDETEGGLVPNSGKKVSLPAATPDVEPVAKNAADGASAPQACPEEHKKAQRLARLIVADIALYNASQVDTGIRNGTFYKILDDDIREGCLLYERRIPEEIRRGTSYLDDAFADFVARKQQELNISVS